MGFGESFGRSFRLGLAQNIFDAGTGDKSAAETLRDNYASANANWVTYYTENEDRYIQLRYVESGNRIAEWQNYDGTNWIRNESIEGVPGLPGSGTDFSSLPDYSIPLIGPGPGKIPIPSGINRTDNGEGAYEFEETASFPQESIQVGFSGILSALGALPMFRSFVTGRRGTFAFMYYDPSTGTTRVYEISAGSTNNVPVETDTSTELTSGGTIQLTTTAAEIIHKMNLSPKTGDAPTDLRMRFTVEGQSDPFYYWPSKNKWDTNEGATVPENGQLDIQNSPMLVLGIDDPDDPVTVNVEYAFSNGTLLGSSVRPALSVDRNVITLKALARLDELNPFFKSVTRSHGYITLTTEDGSTHEVSVADYDRVYRNLGQGATSGSLSINLIESSWVDCHPDVQNVSRIYLPSNSNLHSDEAFIIDFGRVSQDKQFDTEIPNSAFRDGSTSITLKAGHVIHGWAHLDNIAQPPSPTNPIRIYTTQSPVDGDMGPVFHPNFEKTAVVSHNGNDSNSGRALPSAVQTVSRAKAVADALSGHTQMLCLDASVFTEATALTLSTSQDLVMPYSEFIGTINTPEQGSSNIDLFRLTGALNQFANSSVRVHKQNGNVSIGSGSHTNTELRIDEFESGQITFSDTASGVIYVEINSVHQDFVTPTIPNGVTLVGRVGSTYFLGSTESAPITNCNNTFFLDSTFDGESDGNRVSPFSSLSSALTATSNLPSSQHKAMQVLGVDSFGELRNTSQSGNVGNLIVHAPDTSFGGIILADHATSINCRVVSGNVQLADQCNLYAHNIASSSSSTILFTNETHDNTAIRARRVEATVNLSFAGISSGSTVICQIDHYEGDVDAAIQTIPDGVNVYGWIGRYSLPLQQPLFSNFDGIPESFNVIEELVGSYNLVYNLQFAESVNSVTVLASRGNRSRLLTTSFNTNLDGRNTGTMSFSSDDILELAGDSGDIELTASLSINSVTHGGIHLGTIRDESTSLVTVNETRNYVKEPPEGSFQIADLHNQVLIAGASANIEIEDAGFGLVFDVVATADGAQITGINSATVTGYTTLKENDRVSVVRVGNNDYRVEVLSPEPVSPNQKTMYATIDGSNLSVLTQHGTYTGEITVARASGQNAGSWTVYPSEAAGHVFSRDNTFIQHSPLDASSQRHTMGRFTAGFPEIVLRDDSGNRVDGDFSIILIW